MPNGSLGVRHISFAPQPLDLLSWFYVYLSDFGLFCNLIHHLALYQVSIRRLKSFATPLPPPLTLLLKACGSLRLAVTTCGRTLTSKICAMPDTQGKKLLNNQSFDKANKMIFMFSAERTVVCTGEFVRNQRREINMIFQQ